MTITIYLPSFLWKNIISFLPYDAIAKLIQIDPIFNEIASNQICHHKFINLKAPIIVVKESDKTAVDFWKYSYHNHRSFTNLSAMFHSIAGHNMFRKNKSKLMQYKIYFNNYNGRNKKSYYDFGQARCSIDLTTLSNNSNRVCFGYLLHIANIEFLTIDNIFFKHGPIKITGTIHVKITNCTFIYNDFVEIYQAESILLQNNIFTGTKLHIINANNNYTPTITISNNKFDGQPEAQNLIQFANSIANNPSTIIISGNTFAATSLLFNNKTNNTTTCINSNLD